MRRYYCIGLAAALSAICGLPSPARANLTGAKKGYELRDPRQALAAFQADIKYGPLRPDGGASALEAWIQFPLLVYANAFDDGVRYDSGVDAVERLRRYDSVEERTRLPVVEVTRKVWRKEGSRFLRQPVSFAAVMERTWTFPRPLYFGLMWERPWATQGPYYQRPRVPVSDQEKVGPFLVYREVGEEQWALQEIPWPQRFGRGRQVPIQELQEFEHSGLVFTWSEADGRWWITQAMLWDPLQLTAFAVPSEFESFVDFLVDRHTKGRPCEDEDEPGCTFRILHWNFQLGMDRRRFLQWPKHKQFTKIRTRIGYGIGGGAIEDVFSGWPPQTRDGRSGAGMPKH